LQRFAFELPKRLLVAEQKSTAILYLNGTEN